MAKNNNKAIEEAAYFIWQNAGCPMGNDEYFWALAVEQLNGSSKSSSSKSSSLKASAATKKSPAKKSAPAAKKPAAKKKK